MGLGNLSRKVGMNKKPRTDRKTLGEARSDAVAEKVADEEKFQASNQPEKRERKGVEVTNLTEDIQDLISDFAEVEAQLKVLNAKRDELKELATKMSEEHGIDDFVSPLGKVQIIKKNASKTFDKKKAISFMTEEQSKSCQGFGKVPAPSVKFILPK